MLKKLDWTLTIVLLLAVTSACGKISVEPQEDIPPGYVKVVVLPNHLTTDIAAALKRIHFIGDLTVEAALSGNVGDEAADRAFRNRDLREAFSITTPSLEGYVVAGKYYVDPKGTALEALHVILSKSASRYASPDRKEKAEKLGISPRQLLTMASIVQRETCGTDEMPRIASVLFNRINKSMPLQVDVTLLYHLQRWDGRITKQELKLPTPYNTYVFKGLPPTPIGSPSISAVDAILNPENSDYLFFAASGKCRHFFSEDYRDHEDFVFRNLRGKPNGQT